VPAPERRKLETQLLRRPFSEVWQETGRYQIWCGPAIGGLNRWTRGTVLAQAEQRDAVALARALLTGAAVLQRRELAPRARVYRLPTPVAAGQIDEAWLA
jgi:hypothetical protein